MRLALAGSVLFAVLVGTTAVAQGTRITVQADRPAHRLSRLLTGACIEDVNHEIYGGLWSQMLFGESFQEPPVSTPPRGFTPHGGEWVVRDGILDAAGGNGPMLASEGPVFADGEVAAELFFADREPGSASLIARMANPGRGEVDFEGYEVLLEPASQRVRLVRRRHDWGPALGEARCDIAVGGWTPVAIRLDGSRIEVLVNGRSVIRHDDGAGVLPAGTVGMRTWQRDVRYRALRIARGGADQAVAFEPGPDPGDAGRVSGMWRPLQRGAAKGEWAVEAEHPLVGRQSQRLTLTGGPGEIGIENQGLNRWGLHFAAGRPYEGFLRARAEKATDLWVALESADGARILAEQQLRVTPGAWRRLEFSLTPRATERRGRFAIKLRQAGSVTVGYAQLQPGPWGRFQGLPVRRDVAEGIIDQGVTLLRYGGSMVNEPGYRWKKMVGPADERPPYRGHWYRYSSNGWAMTEFMALGEAAGIEFVPVFNMGETPQDMADFVEYAKGPASSEWGRRRVADGHPAPYPLKYLELGNEERIDDAYADAFEKLAAAVWAKDPELTLVVGDFLYNERIEDPFAFTGALSGITSLSAHQRILRFARQRGREVWFDVHVWTDGPRPDGSFDGMLSYVDALERVAEGAPHRVAVFEFNAGNHTHKRALANALAIQAIQRDGRIPVAVSANGLQPDGQNDNGWDQGLLFLDPSQVWLQPPGWVTRMVSKNHQPLSLPARVEGPGGLDVSASRSEDGRTLVVQVVNVEDQAATAALRLEAFSPSRPTARVEQLAGPLDARNTAAGPRAIAPVSRDWPHGLGSGAASLELPPRSFTVIRFE